MANVAFASGLFNYRRLLVHRPRNGCTQSEGCSFHTRLALQDVSPIIFSKPAASLPTGTLYHILRGSPPHLPAAQNSIDGDGYVLALTITSENIFLRGRYVRTRAYLRELRVGRRLYPSRGGTPSTRRYRRLKSSCADGVVVWSGKVFAWGESGLPMWLDPSTLVSRGYSALGSLLTDREELFGERGQALGAPPVVVSADKVAVCATGDGGALFVNVMNDSFETVQRLPPVRLGRGTLVLDFSVSEKFFVVLCARCVTSSAAVTLQLFLSGATAAAAIDTQKGSFVAIVSRSNSTDATILDVPGNRFCYRIVNVRDEGSRIVLSLLDHFNARSPMTRAQLSDLRLAIATGCSALVAVSHFVADPSSRRMHQVQSTPDVIVNDKIVLRDLSPCSRFGSVVDASCSRSGIARVEHGEPGDVVWMGENGAAVTGVVASPNGKTVSALVVADGKTWIRFWDAEKISGGKVHEIDLSGKGFGDVSHSHGCVWSDVSSKWPEGGKVVKSAYEIFDDRNWNDINSGFSSLGINQ